MQTPRCRTVVFEWLSGCVVALVFSFLFSTASAAEIRLKNGMTLRGNLLVSNSLSDRFMGKSETEKIEDKEPVPRLIARIDTGWQRIHFPVQQEDRNFKANLALSNPVKIPLPRPRRQAGNLTVTQFGSITAVEPFDEFGRRRIAIALPKGNMNVFQSITEVLPDHVLVESTNCVWNLGLSPKSIPVETLDKMLKKVIKSDDVTARFALARFYAQAGYFPQALNELDAIAVDFPDKMELVKNRQSELMNYFGGEILRVLGRRKRAGQHQLAEAYARKLLAPDLRLTGAVQQDVQTYVNAYEEGHHTIERAKQLLGDWQEKLNNNEQSKQLQPLRSEINEQLDFETLSRLDPFLKAEADNQYDPSQRLGLAYSGWVLGPAFAIPDLGQAIRVWDARRIVLDYLRTEDVTVQRELIKKLQSMENISTKLILNMTAQLPPILDSMIVEPDKACHLDTESAAKISYWVKLPAEYSPNHYYPLIVALRPAHRTTEQTLAAWSGESTDPDLGCQRGYIVIAPDYVDNSAVEYSFGATAHKAVLECLIDARKRFTVDSDRVFLTGHGMGGDAAFDIGFAHPDEFAGIIPLGGNAINYCKYTWENGSHTAWYVIGKGYDTNGGRDPSSNAVFDNMMKRGFKFDFTLVEYLGRNGENLADEIPKLFDWMDLHAELHARPKLPKQFKMSSLRKTDNRFFWMTVDGLPHDYILPAPAGDAQKITPMTVEVKILESGNVISLPRSLATNHTLRLTPELVDFDKRVLIRIGDRIGFHDFVKEDTGVLLEELRLRGDRKRLPSAVITLP